MRSHPSVCQAGLLTAISLAVVSLLQSGFRVESKLAMLESVVGFSIPSDYADHTPIWPKPKRGAQSGTEVDRLAASRDAAYHRTRIDGAAAGNASG